SLPHARLLPADGRDRERGRHADRDRPGDAAGHDLRAPGPHDRPRLLRLDGEEEARRLLLSPRAQATPAPPPRANDAAASSWSSPQKCRPPTLTVGTP